MIYTDEHIIRALELRFKLRPYKGTLCVVHTPCYDALAYFGLEPWEDHVYNPYMALPKDMVCQMDRKTIGVLNTYNNLYNPPFTNDEIQYIMATCNKYKIRVAKQGKYITIYKE